MILLKVGHHRGDGVQARKQDVRRRNDRQSTNEALSQLGVQVVGCCGGSGWAGGNE